MEVSEMSEDLQITKEDMKVDKVEITPPNSTWFSEYSSTLNSLKGEADVHNAQPLIANTGAGNPQAELDLHISSNKDKLLEYHKKTEVFQTYKGQQQFDLEKSNFLSIISNTFPSYTIFDEARNAAVEGKDSFAGSDGVNYAIPAVMLPKVKKPWYYDNNGALDLSNYTDHNEPAQLGENMPEGEEDLIYEEQVNNKILMEALRRRHGASKTNEQLLELWAAEQHWVNYNIAVLTYDASTMENLTRQEKKDYLLLMETWDRTSGFGDGSQGFWDQLLEIGTALVSDPTTYIGLGTFGAGFFGKEAGKQAEKGAIKLYLKQSVKEAVKFNSKAGAIEGFFYGLSDSVLRQTIEQKAQEKITDISDVDLDVKRTATDTAIGTVGGLTLGGSLTYVGRKLTDKVSSAIEEVDLLEGAATTATEKSEVDIEAPTTTQKTEGDSEEALKDYDPLDANLRKGQGYYAKTRIIFNNDVEKAVYFGGNVNNPSKNYDRYVKYAMEQLGMAREDIILLGKHMRSQIGEKLASRTGDTTEPLKLDFSVIPAGKRVVLKATTKTTEDGEGGEEIILPATAQEKRTAQDLIDSINKVDPDAPTKPVDGAPINFERTQVYPLATSQGIIENFKVTQKVQLNKDTEKEAMRILTGFKTHDDVRAFLEKFSGKTNIDTLHVDATVARMIYASEANKVARLLDSAKTPTEKLTVLLTSSEHMQSLQAVAVTVQKNSTAAGRVLQAMNIDVKAVDKMLSNLVNSAKIINETNAKGKAQGLEGDDLAEFVEKAFSKEDLARLSKEMDELVAQMDSHNQHQRGALPAFSKDDPWHMKAQRVLTEIWLSANLSSMSTQTGALGGSYLKRSTLKGEGYLQWLIGKTFNSEDRVKWNEMRALQQGDYSKSFETFKMLLRMMSFGGQRGEAIMQIQSLDGFSTKWDDHTTHGAINAAYLGWENPDNLLKILINNTIDKSGNIIRSPFTALSLADDVMKRIYYLPHIRSQAVRQANGLHPDNPIAHQNFVEEMVRAYELFYMKKGKRDHTIKVGYEKFMAKFNKDNPDADFDAVKAAEFKAQEDAEKLVEFTAKEKDLLDRVGVDDTTHEQALEYLRSMLFQTDIPVDSTSVTGRGLGVVKKTRDIMPLLQTQFPYLKTVLNMTKDTLQRFPATALLSRDMRADIAAGGRRRDNAIAKLVMGSSFTTMGYYLYEGGWVTPTTDFKDFQTEAATGVKGGMLHIPGTDYWIPLNRIEPLGSFLLAGANLSKLNSESDRIQEILENASNTDAIQKDLKVLEDLKTQSQLMYMTMATNMFSEKSGAQSVRKLMSVLQNPDSDASGQWIKQYTTGFIPLHAAVRQYKEGTISYEAKTFEEHFRKKLGLMSTEYGDRDTLNFLGEENKDIERLGIVHWRTSKPKKGDYVLAKLFELKPGFRKMDNIFTIPGTGVKVQLTYKQTYELNSLMADPAVNARGELFKVMRDPLFKKLDDGMPGEDLGPFKTKISVLRSTYSKLKLNAQKLYMTRHKEEIKSIHSSTINLMQLQKDSSKAGGAEEHTSNILKIMLGQ